MRKKSEQATKSPGRPRRPASKKPVETKLKLAEESLRRVSRLYATLSKVNQAVIRVKEQEELFKTICRSAVECGQFRMAWIGLIDAHSGRVKPVTYSGHEEGYLQCITISISEDSPFGRGPSGLAIQTGTVVTSDNIQTDPKILPWREEALKRGYLSSAAVPFRFKGQVIGALSLYAAEPSFFHEEMQRLLEEIGANISFSLDSMAAEAERKQAEAELRENEARFGKVFDEGPLGMAMANFADGHFISVNRAFCKMLGYTEDELKRLTFVDVTHPDHRAEDGEAVKNLREGNIQKHNAEKRYLKKNGEVIWATRALTRIASADGKSFYALAMIDDISEHKQAEEALRFSEKKFVAAFQASPDAITITSAKDGRIIEANETASRLTGYSREELIGHSTIELNIWADESARERYIALLREHGRVVEMEAGFRIKSGEIRDCLMSGEWISVEGQPYILGIIRDITERKRTEAALRESEEKYRNLVETISEAIYAIDENGVITFISPVVEGLFGYKPQTLIGRNFMEFVLKDDQSIIMNRLLDIRGGGASLYSDFRLISDSGEVKWVRTRTSPLIEGERFVGARGTLIDISARKQAEEKLKETLDGLRKAFEGIIEVLSMTVEKKDPYTSGHQKRVADLARAIALELGLDRNQTDGLFMAGIIHDLGKLSVPAEILSKPGQLTEIEFQMIQVHPQTGWDILSKIDLPWPIGEMILQHHERMNGSGYPQGLKGENIRLEARILAVSDVVEAMASHRPYRSALGIDAALAEIEKNKSILYDPDVAEACLKLFREKGYAFEQ